MNAQHYVGTELDLFRDATHWKAYVRSHIAPFLGDNILEVGAGLSGTTCVFCGPDIKRWVCLEPDAKLAVKINGLIQQRKLPESCKVVVGTLEHDDIQKEEFDTILYIDVLEHIENDKHELQNAANRLSPHGHIIVLAPAHQWLYSPFDEAIGHFRRYTRPTLAALTPARTRLVWSGYLDAIGLTASLGNRMFLRRSMPTVRQIAIWDRCMVPLSRWIDPLVRNLVGKSVLTVWTKA